MIDLHTHSTFSDGNLTPEELVQEAARLKLHALALTDHDGMDGVPRFLAACERAGVRGVAGVEISVDCPTGTQHMLGYFVDTNHAELQAVLARLRTARQERNRAILERLNRLGYPLTWEEVAAFAGEEVVGRPHFAQALEARGAVRSKEEAFERLLAKGRPAYADRYRLSPPASIRLISAAGGVPVLAHPSSLDLPPAALRETVEQLVAHGLQGIEVYYPEHGSQQEREYLELAGTFSLVPTGGSDFHGAFNPQVRLGVGFGNLRVPDEILAALEARRPATRP